MGAQSRTKVAVTVCLGAALLGASGCAGEPAYEALGRPAQAVDGAGNAILADAQFDPETARFVGDWNDYSVYLATKTETGEGTIPCILVLKQPLADANWAGACGSERGPVTLGFDGHTFQLSPEQSSSTDSSWTTIGPNVTAK